MPTSSRLDPPVYRLSTPLKGQKGANSADHLASVIPSVRLAHTPGAQGDNSLAGQRGVDQIPEGSAPALLVSYFYLAPFEKNRHRFRFRDWALDSGAFSAHNSGATIDLGAFADAALRLLAEDPLLAEVYSLDVIGDWRASLRNTEELWRRGVPAIPTFHFGEPEDVLLSLARDYPKVAIGGAVGLELRKKRRFAEQCFARVWPKKLHGFGYGSKRDIMDLPWHSVDATNWEMGPCAWGVWRSLGVVSVRGSTQNLRAEVEWYLDLERKARRKWAAAWAKFGEEPGPPALRLGCAQNRQTQTERYAQGTGGEPSKGKEADECEP